MSAQYCNIIFLQIRRQKGAGCSTIGLGRRWCRSRWRNHWRSRNWNLMLAQRWCLKTSLLIIRPCQFLHWNVSHEAIWVIQWYPEKSKNNYNLNSYFCQTNWNNWVWYYDGIYLHVGHVATSVWFLHASHMTWPLRHWNIFVGGRISSKQTEHSNSL